MTPLVDALLKRAFHRAPVAAANQAIDEVRATLEAESGAAAFSYELFVPRANVDEFFLSSALPKLVLFLHCRGFRGNQTPGLFISLFTEHGLHFIKAGEALEVMAAAKHLSIDELYRRYGDGGTGDPKLLGT